MSSDPWSNLSAPTPSAGSTSTSAADFGFEAFGEAPKTTTKKAEFGKKPDIGKETGFLSVSINLGL